MAVLISFVVPGLDAELYGEVSQKIQSHPPAGLLFHCASVVPGGMHVRDVWESAEAFQSFAEHTLGPAMATTPAGAPEDLTVSELHAYWNPST
jgi:hypothetical protein